MNLLTKEDVQMTSLDIAEVTGKRHADIMRDIRKEVEDLGKEIAQRIFALGSYRDKNNQGRPCYSFGKKGAMQLALKYDAQTRFKVIERIEELESGSQQLPKTQAELIAMIAQQGVEQERRITNIEEKQDNITSILSLNTINWRNEANSIINAIATRLGGGQYFQEIRNESYQMLDIRASSNVNRRLQNTRERMALKGSSKSSIEKQNILDVIAEDKKLISVYVTVIKELAVKYQLNLSDYQITSEV